MAEVAPVLVPIRSKGDRTSQTIIRQETSHEFVFAVVGHIGAGVSTIADKLQKALASWEAEPGWIHGSFQVELLKARDVITAWAKKNNRVIPPRSKSLEYVNALQDIGDAMRSTDHAAVADSLIRQIRRKRALQQGVQPKKNEPVTPDGKLRAYILDSIRHPAEVHLLRSFYQNAFTLVGVVCDEDRRLERLMRKFTDAGKENAAKLMERDAEAPEKHGQRVADAFHLADYFLDNSENRLVNDAANPDWDVVEQLRRLLKIITHSAVVRPRPEETAMHIAYGAQVRSACISRQVGAAILDRNGNVLSTGTNEVPRAGGGVYGSAIEPLGPEADHRCLYRRIVKEDGTEVAPYCSNTHQQKDIIEGVVSAIMAAGLTDAKFPDSEMRNQLTSLLSKSRIGGILEFSRAVHAEMDALLTAAREGKTTQGGRMYVTTYPCHYCARHIVSAGIDEVQYIEPYPKSKATELHRDSICIRPPGWVPPSEGGTQVLFRPFNGVAPRMYIRAFQKDRELKDKDTGRFVMHQPEWASAWEVSRASYAQLEALLLDDGADDASP